MMRERAVLSAPDGSIGAESESLQGLRAATLPAPGG
jgi:hypothetical protein